MRSLFPFAIFFLFLGLWTWKLLEPNPVPETVRAGIPLEWDFWLAKSLHAGGYAFLAVLASFLPVSRRVFWLVIAGLFLHGAATETLQYAMGMGRHGCVRDVLIDWFGIGVGVLALRWWGWTCAV